MRTRVSINHPKNALVKVKVATGDCQNATPTRIKWQLPNPPERAWGTLRIAMLPADPYSSCMLQESPV